MEKIMSVTEKTVAYSYTDDLENKLAIANRLIESQHKTIFAYQRRDAIDKARILGLQRDLENANIALKLFADNKV